ncbi:MAG: DNA alkylation repair protein [Pseudomonadota bacterium]
MTAKIIKETLRDLANTDIAEHSQRFFKTGEGEYGEGDQFLGIRVPVLRKQVKSFEATSLAEIQKVLMSPFHEERLFSLLLLAHKFNRGDEHQQAAIYEMYLNNTKYINNWDLVDCSAHKIVGPYLEKRDRQPLYQLVESDSLWERRIAIIATYHYIRNNEFEDTLKLSKRLLDDQQDLIHKAVGWMLREVGKRNLEVEKSFLKDTYKTMPRTMLRYAIEKFPEQERKQYLHGKV